MLFALAALVGALGVAGAEDPPRPHEDIAIADLHVRKLPDNDTVTDVSFLLSGRDATSLACNAIDLGVPPKTNRDKCTAIVTCGESKYRFALCAGNETEYALRIYHELGLAVGFWGEGDVFTYCHAGGLGSLVCAQQYPTTILIQA